MPLPRLARASAAAATLAVAALTLTACSSTDPADPSATPTTDATLEFDLDNSELLAGVEWVDGVDGAAPTLEFEVPFELASTAVRLVSDGDGDVISDGDVAQLDYEVVYGDTGETAFSTYLTGVPEAIVISEAGLAPAMYSNLVGAHVGAELIFGSFDANNPNEDGTLPTILMSVTVTSAVSVLAAAEGTAVDPVDGLPVVTLDDFGAPSIDFTGTANPGELVVQPLIVGDGPEVEQGQQLSVHYTGWLWDGDVFDSSWARGTSSTFEFTATSLIDGWVVGLEGQPIGSQVLLILPPELAYGDQESESIPAGSTLVFVVDILAAY